MVSTEVGVLDKVMAILTSYDDHIEVLDPPAAAQRTGMSTPTAYRLMKSMAAHGLLTPTGGGYGLGPSLLRLGSLVTVGLDVLAAARPHMVALRERLNETVELHVLVQHSRVPIHLETSTRTVRSASQVGHALPLHKGASSRPLVAWRADAMDLARASATDAGDVLDEDAYSERLALIRERGWDVGLGERDAELAASAAPVFAEHKEVAATIVVSGTVTRFRGQAHCDAAIRGALDTARLVTADLGGTFPV